MYGRRVNTEAERRRTMSNKKGYSAPGLFGQINHYDEKGRKVGESRPGLFGGFTEYDANGHKTGESRPGFFGSLKNGISLRKIAKICKVDRNTLARFIELKELAVN